MVLAAAGVSGWFFIFKNKPVAPILQHELALKTIATEPAASMAASLNNDSLWYVTRDGHFFRTELNSLESTEVGFPALAGKKIEDIKWQPNGQDFLVVTTTEPKASEKSGTREVSYYNKQNNSLTVLPSNVKDIDWLPDGKRVAMVWLSGDGKNKLVVSDPDASGYRIIADLSMKTPVVKVSPTEPLALVVNNSLEGKTNPIYLINLDDGSTRSFASDSYNWGALWLPSGKQFLSQREQSVYLFDVADGTMKDLELKAANLGKLAFDASGRYLFAAVDKDTASDKFVRLDMDSGEKTDYFIPSENLRANDLLFFSGELFFFDATTGNLRLIE